MIDCSSENLKPPLRGLDRRKFIAAGAALSLPIGARSDLAHASATISAIAGGGPAKINGLKAGEIDRVSDIYDGDSFTLSSGLRVKLASIDAPRLPNRPRNQQGWPYARRAKSRLSELIAGKRVQLYYDNQRRDRYGRAIAHIYRLDDQSQRQLWVQEAMLLAGLARVNIWPNESHNPEPLYAAETLARDKRRHIWGDEFYAIRSPEPHSLVQFVDTVQIVEGYILSAANVRGRVYLNFGADYKSDFTVVVDKKMVKACIKAGFDPPQLEGAWVRIRGWIELYNGPSIWLNHPHQLEIIEGLNI